MKRNAYSTYSGKRKLQLPALTFAICGASFLLISASIFRFPPIRFLSYVGFCLSVAFGVYFLLRIIEDNTGSIFAKIGLYIMRGLFIAGLVSFIIIEIFVISGAKTDSENADYLIVLGAGVDGTTPSLILHSRLVAALDYLENSPQTIAILSGGQGPGEDITEAEAMLRWLTSRGIDESRIIKEELSRDTIQNLQNSFSLINLRSSGDGSPEIAVLSNDFHIFRARFIAEREGVEIGTVSANTPRAHLEFTYTIREYFSVGKVLLTYLFT